MNEAAPLEMISQENVESDLNGLFRAAIRVVLESVLEDEVEQMVGAEKYAKLASRKDYRNGSYLRRVLTSMGEVEVAMPRTRFQGSPTHVVGQYRRRTGELDDAITQAYVSGVSTRDVAKVTEALAGHRVTRSTVSRVTKALDERVAELRASPITQKFPYVYLDATFIHARWARSVENVSVLVAYGVSAEDGHRHLLGVSIGAEESEASWNELLSELVARGLDGVQLVISDEHAGLVKSARRHFPEAKHQRCVVHFERNVLSKAPAKLRSRLGKLVSAVFSADSRADAAQKLSDLKLGLGTQVPEAIECLEKGFAASTTFFSFPKAHWRRIRTTNSLERLHGELKRRIRSVGAFPDRASALRLATAVAIEKTDIWSDRRYLDMSLLNTSNVETDQVA